MMQDSFHAGRGLRGIIVCFRSRQRGGIDPRRRLPARDHMIRALKVRADWKRRAFS
jgi:hypothetical protein